MPEKEPKFEFDFESYLATLMEAMEMDQAPPEIQQDVTYQLGRQLGYQVLTTLSLNFGEEDWSAFEKNAEANEFQEAVSKAISRNPKIKQVILETLDRFYDETMEAFNSFSA